jgi:hypothetical protein
MDEVRGEGGGRESEISVPWIKYRDFAKFSRHSKFRKK